MDRALRIVRKDSALIGKDGVDYKVIKTMPNNAKKVLLKITNRIW